VVTNLVGKIDAESTTLRYYIIHHVVKKYTTQAPTINLTVKGKGKGSSYSITECRVPELIPVLGSQPAGDVSHKPSGRLPLLSARTAVASYPLSP